MAKHSIKTIFLVFFSFLYVNAAVTATTAASSPPSSPPLPPIHTIFGPVTHPEPVIVELINHPVMQRLKEVDQFGPPTIHGYLPKFSRYDHSLGVYYLVQHVGAPVREQVAALLHDASHTALSHVADVVFHSNETKDIFFQDENHTWFLHQMGVGDILAKYGMTVESIDPHKHGNVFKALEQDLPDLCADRIEYNLHTGLITGKLTHDDVIEILADLHFKDGVWYFDTPSSAKKLAMVSLYATGDLFNTDFNAGLYNWYAEAIKRSIDKGYIHANDFIFGTDARLLSKLNAIPDPKVKALLARTKDVKGNIAISHNPTLAHDYVWKTKFRGIDPLVLRGHRLHRLSFLDPEYGASYTATKTLVNQPLYLRNL